ncbi:methionine--tRNA ligase [Ferruginibacter sp. HRS2-29]|uniref:methionine--tRNA ligase n=1 Tax=Ferruginibacter sp. HRS2-29 TaxID=2487334 RepID=UPI0020CC4C06|nr:methionine--tRNA ligase [Ferruginibacter sp. HRS2-29]MCP9751776.1 methionine--tRNA ligase [Ferruginibacter sp. HRS2-29]
MTDPKRYLITSALPYANGPKHIGHLAGAYLPADTYVRYLRAQQKDVVYVCGSDEHGAAITIQAMKENTTPREIVDKYHAMLKSNMADLGISFDIYHRTSAPIHHETAQEFFTMLNDKGDLEIKETEQYFDEEANTFLADRYIVGTCPVCSNPNAYGDQCERCGTSLSPEQLINPYSTLSGKPPIKKSTTHWYLPLDKHEAFLRQWILEDHKEDWKANVLGQCKSWLDMGLQPRAVTRDLDWGIAVPVTGAEGKVLYVWFDAPIGYISATKQWAIDNEKDWKPYWYNDDTKLVHFIGKDNIVFHSIIFPVMLKLHGNILPDNVPSNEFMNLEGDKMSTSRGWSIEMDDYINDFVKPENGGEQMVDALRYYLTAIAPETKDSEFTWKGFQDAVNSELVAVFGNFVNRTFVLMHKLCGGKVPVFHNEIMDEKDKQLLQDITDTKNSIERLIEGYKFRDALYEVIDLARKGNRYMQEKEPWIVAKTVTDAGQPTPEAQARIDNCLHICLQLTANLAIFIHPFLPFAAKKMCYMMKVVDKMLDWENAGKVKLLSVGYSLRAPELLFRKIEDAEVTAQIEKLKLKSQKIKMEGTTTGNGQPTTDNGQQAKAKETVIKETIQFDDFAKIDLKVGTILAAEKVDKADKLLKLEVDLGFEKRTIVSGIALHFSPEEIVGKQVTVVINLAPRKMRGIESNGMILMAEDANGKLQFVNPDVAVENGSGVS